MNDMTRNDERRRWDPFGDFDTLFNSLLRPGAREVSETWGQALMPALDVSESDDAYHVTAELPGVSKDDLDITINDGVLTINAETRHESEQKDKGRMIRQERRYGKFVRSMRLGGDVDEDKVKANYEDGVLHLTLPKSEDVKPRKIDVEVN